MSKMTTTKFTTLNFTLMQSSDKYNFPLKIFYI